MQTIFSIFLKMINEVFLLIYGNINMHVFICKNLLTEMTKSNMSYKMPNGMEHYLFLHFSFPSIYD